MVSQLTSDNKSPLSERYGALYGVDIGQARLATEVIGTSAPGMNTPSPPLHARIIGAPQVSDYCSRDRRREFFGRSSMPMCAFPLIIEFIPTFRDIHRRTHAVRGFQQHPRPEVRVMAFGAVLHAGNAVRFFA